MVAFLPSSGAVVGTMPGRQCSVPHSYMEAILAALPLPRPHGNRGCDWVANGKRSCRLIFAPAE